MDVELWEKCVSFHGHSCGGLMTGFKAAEYAAQLLELKFSDDEETVCISENDACGVDAIQVVLGCTVGKGNLLFHLTGKQAYTFYERESGRGLRLLLRPRPDWVKKGESLEYMRCREPRELFEVMEPRIPLPEMARLFGNMRCAVCGEEAAGAFMSFENGQPVCRDCRRPYRRLDI